MPMLENCQMGDEGCDYLSRGQWGSLRKINIGKYVFI